MPTEATGDMATADDVPPGETGDMATADEHGGGDTADVIERQAGGGGGGDEDDSDDAYDTDIEIEGRVCRAGVMSIRNRRAGFD